MLKFVKNGQVVMTESDNGKINVINEALLKESLSHDKEIEQTKDEEETVQDDE